MFCPECGVENLNVAVFCENCGVKISQKSQKQNLTVPDSSHHEILESFKENLKGAGLERNQSQVVKKKPWSGIRKLIYVELAILFLVGIGFYNVGKIITSPEKIAYRYLVNVHNRNWNEVYGNLSLPQTDFINKEMLLKGNPSSEAISIENYFISDLQLGNNGNSALVTLDYVFPGKLDRMYTQVNLIKQAKKKFLIFDSWKIVPEFVVNDYEIMVPISSRVTLGGIILESNLIYNEDEYFAYYRIPMIFVGNYEIKVEQESMEDSVQVVDTQSGYFNLSKMALDQEVQKELLIEAGDVFKATHEAAFTKSNFSAIKNLFSTEISSASNHEAEYLELFDELRVGYDYGVKYLSFNKIDANTDYYIYEGKTYVHVTLDFDYQYQYYDENMWGERYEDTFESSGEAFYVFELNKGDWEIVSFEITHNIY